MRRFFCKLMEKSILYLTYIRRFWMFAYKTTLLFSVEKAKRNLKTTSGKFKDKKSTTERRGRTIDYAAMASEYQTLPDDYYEQLLTFFTESPRSFKDIGIGFLAPVSSVLDDCVYDLEDDGLTIDKDMLYQLLVLLFWDVMDDSAALGETIQDDIRKGLPGRSKIQIFGLSFDFSTELDKGLIQRIQELLNLDNNSTAKIANKVRDLFFASCIKQPLLYQISRSENRVCR